MCVHPSDLVVVFKYFSRYLFVDHEDNGRRSSRVPYAHICALVLVYGPTASSAVLYAYHFVLPAALSWFSIRAGPVYACTRPDCVQRGWESNYLNAALLVDTYSLSSFGGSRNDFASLRNTRGVGGGGEALLKQFGCSMNCVFECA